MLATLIPRRQGGQMPSYVSLSVVNLVDRRGLEPRLTTCKAVVIPPILAAQICVGVVYQAFIAWWQNPTNCAFGAHGRGLN